MIFLKRWIAYDKIPQGETDEYQEENIRVHFLRYEASQIIWRIYSWTIGDALGFKGLIRAAKEKRKGYLPFRCSV